MAVAVDPRHVYLRDIPTPTQEGEQAPRRWKRRASRFGPLVLARQGWTTLSSPCWPTSARVITSSHSTVTLDIEVYANDLSGRTQIEADATLDLSSFNLDFRGLTVTQVTVGGRPADHSRTGYELTIEPGAPIPVGTTFDDQRSLTRVNLRPAMRLEQVCLIGWINYGARDTSPAPTNSGGHRTGSRSMRIHPKEVLYTCHHHVARAL